MKKTLILLFLIVVINLSILYSSPLELLEHEDKQKHFIASSAVATTSYYYLDNNFNLTNTELILYSIFTTILIGDIKERYWEKNYNSKYDHQDMKANFMGATFGTSISFFSSELQKRRKQKKQIEKLKVK